MRISDWSSDVCSSDLPTDRAAYGRMTGLLTLGKRRAKKGQCHIGYADLPAYGEGQIMVALIPDDWRPEDAGFPAFLRRLGAAFPGSAYLAASFSSAGAPRLRFRRQVGPPTDSDRVWQAV